MYPLQILEKATLTEDVVIDNSPDIYLRIVNLLDRKELVKILRPHTTAAEISLAWRGNASTDREVKKFLLPKNSSLLEALHQVAYHRKEIIIERDAAIILVPLTTKVVRTEYLALNKRPNQDLLRLSNQLISPRPISLLQIDSNTMKFFIGEKLKENTTANSKAGIFKFEMDANAKSEVSKINMIGFWTFQKALDATCVLTGLYWKIEENTLWLVKI